MPLLPTIGRTVGTGVKAVRLLVRGSVRGSVWATRTVGSVRARGAANEAGMVRLFDLHAVSCAGDALIAIGLAGTIFFNVPLGEARGKVALYLLITMVPFALLAPIVGPLLDHFRHGRRYALAVTMLGRAFLAYVISDHLFGWGLYPAAFGVLALSRAYGVARSAAVPRLLPEGVGLSQVGARASVYGTFAGAVVAPIGLAAFWVGPQWSLRVAAVIFVVGMVIALRLPPRADSDPPEAVPRPFRAMLRLRRGGDRPLSGRLLVATLIGSATLRLLYGFLLLFFAFAIKADGLDTVVLGRDIGTQGAVALVGGSLAVGTFLSTAIGTRLKIRRPLALQSGGLIATAAAGVLALVFYQLATVALLALVTATVSGIAKLAVDASIQEKVPERLRASAFAHSETVLMVSWVLGGAIGIIPMNGRLGVAVAAVFAVAAAARAAYAATRLHNEKLQGRPDTSDSPPTATGPSATARGATGPGAFSPTSSGPAGPAVPADPWPEAPTVPHQPPAPRSSPPTATRTRPTEAPPEAPASPTRKRGWRQSIKPDKSDKPGSGEQQPRGGAGSSAGPGRQDESGARGGSGGAASRGEPGARGEAGPRVEPALAPPGFHVYRPSSATGEITPDPDDR